MASKKKVEKSIDSLERQIEKHKEKVREYIGKNYALIEYWEKEIQTMEEEKMRKKRILEK